MSDEERLPATLSPADMLDEDHDTKIRATAQQYSGSAIRVLAEIVEDTSAPFSAQISSAKEILKHAKEDDKSREQSLANAIANSVIQVNVVKFGETTDAVEHFTQPPANLERFAEIEDGSIVDADFEAEDGSIVEATPKKAKKARRVFEPGQDPLSFPMDDGPGEWTE